VTAAAPPGPGGGAPAAASLPRRLAALVYELLLVSAVVLIVGFLSAPLVSPLPPGAPRALHVPDLPARVATFCLVFAALALYFVWSWTSGRRTLPMKTWHLALVRGDGGTLDRRTALARYLACWIGPAAASLAYLALAPLGAGAHAAWLVALNFLWPAVDPQRRFLHDRLAGTLIVDRT
jgi:uncharacterized RDD family membrane protein YckC